MNIMLQRIQSLLLLLSAVSLGVFLTSNTWTSGSGSEQILLNPYHIVQTKSGLAAYQKEIYYIAVMAILAIGISIFTIFQYKNRIRQMLFVALNSLLIGAAVALCAYHIKYDGMKLANADDGTFEIGIYAGFAALAFNWLANRFIKKDEKLVKNADRMR